MTKNSFLFSDVFFPRILSLSRYVILVTHCLNVCNPFFVKESRAPLSYREKRQIYISDQMIDQRLGF